MDSSLAVKKIPPNRFMMTRRYTQQISVHSHRQPLTPTRSIIDRLPNLISVSPTKRKVSMTSNRQQSKNSVSTPAPRLRRHTIQHTIPTTQQHFSRNALTHPRLQKQKLRIVFRRIIRLVQVLCRVCIAIRRYAVNKNDNRAIAEFQNLLRPPATDNLPDTGTNNGPYFNKHVYSVQNNHTFPAWARILCSQPAEYRKEEDLIKLRSYLRGHNAFAQFDYETQIVICQNVVYNRYDKKRIILNQVCIIFSSYCLLNFGCVVILIQAT